MGGGLDSVYSSLQPPKEESMDKTSEKEMKILNESDGIGHLRVLSDTSNTSGSAKGINYPPNPSLNSSENRNLELVLVEQCVASALEGQAFTEKIHPLVGVLVGSAPPDSNCAIIKSFYRIQRNLSQFEFERRSSPSDVIGSVNRRIRDEGSMILGYYFCVDAFSCTLSKKENTIPSSSYGVDHVRLLNAIVQTECPRPIVLQIQRIWKTDGDLEASIRFDFFAAVSRDQTMLNPLNYKILDSAFPSPGILRSIIDSEFIILDEMESYRKNTEGGGFDNNLNFDSNLNEMCINTEKKIQAFLWNANNRLDMEKLYLKRLIHGRMAQIANSWESHKKAKSTENNGTSPSNDSSEKCESLIVQLLKKDMPVALADTLRKLPISSHLTFYDRPTIAMKSTRLPQNSPFLWGGNVKSTTNSQGSEQGNNRKRKSYNKVTIHYTKGPPRLILPAGSVSNSGTRSASTSSETSTTNSTIPISSPESLPKTEQPSSEVTTANVVFSKESPPPSLIITIPTTVSSTK